MKKIKVEVTESFGKIMENAKAYPENYSNKVIENKNNTLIFNNRGELVRIKYFNDFGVTADSEFTYSCFKEFYCSTVFSVLVVKKSTIRHYETHFNKSINDLIEEEKNEELKTIHIPRKDGRLSMIWNAENGIVGEE